MKAIVAIKKYFEQDGSKVELAEIRALSLEERDELGRLACIELCTEYEPTIPKAA